MRQNSRPASKRSMDQSQDRLYDLLGLGLIGLSLIVLVTLVVKNGGVLGNGLTSLFRILFGQGAWAMPIFLAVIGIITIIGKTKFESMRSIWGAAITFLCLLAGMAKQTNGDYFIDEAMRTGGGYFGAITAWGFDGLLGSAKTVALVICGLIGLTLALNLPIRELIHKFQEIARSRRIEAKIKDATSAAETKEEKRARRAVVALPDEDEEDEPVKPKRAPITFSQSKSDEVSLDTQTREPTDGYELPPLNLLHQDETKKKRDPQEAQRNIEILEDTLDQFNIDANVIAVASGPTITRYEVQLGPGIRVNKITNLADNIALSLAASHVRVEAPIPGKSAIGIEIPNAVRQMVTLREMCDSLEFHDKSHKLCLALGKDVSGERKYTDLSRMPHLLVGGSTNSGKSISLATMIMSLILKMTPRELRLVMIDPKRVELTLCEGLPHLMCPVVKDVKEAAGVLRAVVREMDRRYEKFSNAGVRNIDGWNAKANEQDKCPYIVVFIDELADLMIQCGAEVETSICRLAQLARATGIHLVIATQRPSVDVITGTIKNNIASRIAFAVSSSIDSRTILDQAGAEDLVGRGDMLFLPIDATKPVRIQGCYVTEKELEAVCNFWRQQEKPHYVLNPMQIAIEEKAASIREEQESDPLFEEVVRWVVERGQASTSMMQRKFSIGFQRAGRLMDLMEDRGIVGPRDGSRPRQVLVDTMQAESILGHDEYASPMPEGSYLDDDE